MKTIYCKRCKATIEPIINENFKRDDGKIATHASCPICNSFLRFLPRNDRTDFTFYFGQYYGKKLSELKGKQFNNYLEYIKRYDELKPWQIDLIDQQITKNKRG